MQIFDFWGWLLSELYLQHTPLLGTHALIFVLARKNFCLTVLLKLDLPTPPEGAFSPLRKPLLEYERKNDPHGESNRARNSLTILDEMLKNLAAGDPNLNPEVSENWDKVQIEIKKQLHISDSPPGSSSQPSPTPDSVPSTTPTPTPSPSVSTTEKKETDAGSEQIEQPIIKKKPFNFRLWSYLEKTHGNAGIHCSMIVDSSVWAGCQDGTIAIWHIRTGQLIGSRQAHKARIFSMTRVDENVWTASDDNKIRIWTPYACFLTEILLEFRLTAMVNCGSTIWCGSFDQKCIAIVDAETFKVIKIVKLDIPVRYLFRDNDEIWICSENDILLIDRNTYEFGESIPGIRMNFLLRVKENIWAASSDSTISIYDGKTKKIIHMIKGFHEQYIFSLMVYGNYVWSAGWDKFIFIWDSENFSLVGSLSGHKEPINSIIVVPMTLPVKAISRPINPTNPLDLIPKPLSSTSSTPLKSSFSSMFGLLSNSSTPPPVQPPPPIMPSRPASPAPAIETMDVPIECTIYSVWSSSWDGAVIMWL